MRRWAIPLTALLLLLILSAPALAGEYLGFPTANVIVNERPVESDVPALIIEGRTLLPVRAVAEALSCEVEWRDETKTALITGPVYYSREKYEQFNRAILVWANDLLDAIGRKDEEFLAKEKEKIDKLPYVLMVLELPDELMDFNHRLALYLQIQAERARLASGERKKLDDLEYDKALLEVSLRLLEEMSKTAEELGFE